MRFSWQPCVTLRVRWLWVVGRWSERGVDADLRPTTHHLRPTSLFDHREDVVLAHDHQLFAVELDFGAGVAGEDDFVALLHAERGAFAVVEALAVADGEDLAALGLFLGAVGEDDAALGLGLGLDALDEDL